MKSFHRLLSWLTAPGLFLISTAAWANPLPGNLWFDEYGAGYYWNDGMVLPQRLQSSVGTDPTSGVAENVLTYWLPFELQPTPGDVVLTNPDDSWSDVIRFALLGVPPDSGFSGQPVVIYYSNAGDGPGKLPADVHSMPQVTSNAVTNREMGLTWYKPKVNELGYEPTFGRRDWSYVFYGEQASYNDFSDGGITALLLAMALVGTHFLRRVRAWNTSA